MSLIEYSSSEWSQPEEQVKLVDKTCCTCGFAEKIEAALERIFGARDRIALILSKNDREIRVVSDEPPAGVIARVRYSYEQFCDLGLVILELADKVKPLKPEEPREWRVGDIVILRLSGDTVHGLAREIRALSERRIEGFYIHGNPAEMGMKGWRNLTIEAEQAREER